MSKERILRFCDSVMSRPNGDATMPGFFKLRASEGEDVSDPYPLQSGVAGKTVSGDGAAPAAPASQQGLFE